MEALIFAQTLFYLTFSLFLMVLLISASLAGYHLIRIAKNLDNLSENLNQASEEVKENIREIMERLSKLPFLSFFMKKPGNKNKKGRSN